MYSDSQLNITTHVPLSDRGGGGCSFSFSSSPATDPKSDGLVQKRLRRGDVNPSDGTIFWCYERDKRVDGSVLIRERWMTPQRYKAQREWKRLLDDKYQAGDTYKRGSERRRQNQRNWKNSERGKQSKKEYLARPEVRAKRQEASKRRWLEYKQRPDVIAAKEERCRQREQARNSPEYIASQRGKQNEYIKRRYRENPNLRLAMKVRARIYSGLKRRGIFKTSRTEELIGCSFDFLRQHIERQFKGKMSWDNPGSFHIDHIVPLAAFDLTDPAQLKVACNWQNMRPLSPRKNMSKGAKLLHPQQQLPLSVHSTTFNTQAA
jgi:hypothetical protein